MQARAAACLAGSRSSQWAISAAAMPVRVFTVRNRASASSYVTGRMVCMVGQPPGVAAGSRAVISDEVAESREAAHPSGMPSKTRSPRELAARALCHLDGKSPDITVGRRPAWAAYLPQVDAVLRVVLGDAVWEALVVAERTKSRSKTQL